MCCVHNCTGIELPGSLQYQLGAPTYGAFTCLHLRLRFSFLRGRVANDVEIAEANSWCPPEQVYMFPVYQLKFVWGYDEKMMAVFSSAHGVALLQSCGGAVHILAFEAKFSLSHREASTTVRGRGVGVGGVVHGGDGASHPHNGRRHCPCDRCCWRWHRPYSKEHVPCRARCGHDSSVGFTDNVRCL